MFARRKLFACLIVAAGTLSQAVASDYPNKPVVVIVPSSPGGVLDVLARTMGQRLSGKWGQPVVVENRPGASFEIGAAAVAKAPPDGYTLLVAPETTFTVNPTLFPKRVFDSNKDLSPITALVNTDSVLITNPSFPAKNIGELISSAKEKPSEINYATVGVGSTQHLQMALFEKTARVKLSAVSYKGAAPALTDVIAGHVSVMFIAVKEAMPHYKSGKLRILAVGSSTRIPELPEIPTFEESGLSDFRSSTWFGLFAPGGTPRDIIDKINADVREVYGDPGFREQFLAPNMFRAITNTPDQFATIIISEEKKWGVVLRDMDIKAE